ncbi:MAG: flagellar biosynthetic protein FliO, partial [Bdellovibrionales bacterium]|nr:flagellar biosynthetic protein FliO [Bdellovibrionales bacterium]
YTANKASIELINHTVQVNLPNAYFEQGKELQRVTDKKIKSIFTYQANRNLLRSRIIYLSDHLAKDLEGKIKVESKGKSVFVRITDSSVAATPSAVSRVFPVIPPNDLNGELERALEMAAPEDVEATPVRAATATDILSKDMVFPSKLPEKKEANRLPDEVGREKVLAKMAEESIAAPKEDISSESMAEKDIPVLTTAEVKKSENEEASTYWRMAMSLVVVLVFAGALIVGAKYWTRNRVGAQEQTKIRILTQHAMGPKKSLAIIQVAGESILIGVTDHNINLIKTLALLDEEIPSDTPNSFAKEMTRAGIGEDEITDRFTSRQVADNKQLPASEEDEFSFGKIQSQIADRLKEMRSL